MFALSREIPIINVAEHLKGRQQLTTSLNGEDNE